MSGERKREGRRKVRREKRGEEWTKVERWRREGGGE